MNHRSLAPLFASLALIVASCGGSSAPPAQPPAQSTAPSAAFEALVDRFVNQRWETSPVAATEAGVAGYDDRLPDYSAAALDRRLTASKDLLRSVQTVDPATLSNEQQIDRQLLIGTLEWSIRNDERRRPWETEPGFYVPLQAITGLIEKDTIPLEQRAQAVTARLLGIPALVDQGRQNLKNPPKAFTEAAVFQVRGAVRFLKDELPAFAARVSGDRAALLAANTRAIMALEGYGTFLEKDLLPRSTGQWMLGREDYDFILKRRWYLNDDATTILAKGKKAFEETEKLLQVTAERISPGKPWVEVYERLEDDHPPADQVRQAYQTQIDAAQRYVREHDIVTLPPGERVVTIDTPLPMRRSSPYGTFHGVGPFEKRLVGTLSITPIEHSLSPEQRRERVRAHHNAWIPIIAVHEAYPGHHVQALKANENPRVLRRLIHESIFAEGWGLFCEELMYEQGFLKGDGVRLTQLRNRLWRAARVIIDVGIHTGTMTFEQGVQFLVDKVRFDRYAAELEVGMYIRSPTMVLGYLIGMMEIQDMREQYYAKFGKPAKPKEFYDKLLHIGAIPPGLVRRELLGAAAPAPETK